MTKYELAQYFVTVILEKNINIETRVSYAIEAIDQLLKEGWTIKALKEELDEFKKVYPSLIPNIYHITEIIGNKKPPNNLIDSDIFYYHNALRETSPPTKLIFNEETRKYERIESPFFLEMKKVFTLDDLLNYWYEKNEIKYQENNVSQDKARFSYLLKYYDLDEILFMIDIAYEDREIKRLKPLRNVFHLEEYAEEAKEAIKRKRSVQQVHQINYIMPKEDSHV